jgi:hypothetical protein
MDRLDRVDSVWTWVTLIVVIVVAVLTLHWPLLVFAPLAAWPVWEMSIKLRGERQRRRQLRRNCGRQIARIQRYLAEGR